MSKSNVWEKFPAFIREFVFSNGWKELYDIQEEAAEIILETDFNLLLSCGTASGKTEAVFFPMLADLYSHKACGTEILYIAPLKALINDQFDRIRSLCDGADITVHHRHGDVSAYEKEKYFESPARVLQITPESLEALIMRHPTECTKTFENIKYIVIDELHSVISTDRGNQVRCLIGRIMQLTGALPRIFGLSASIGDKKSTGKWISECNGIKTVCPEGALSAFKASLLFEVFDTRAECEEFIYNAVKKKNTLVFANSRDETERITFALSSIAKKNNDRDDIYIHHGNISTSLRKDAEKALKDRDRHSVVCATSTLELGIDIGRLERVVSIGSPNTVSGFLQRLGRSGRRGASPEMLSVFCLEREQGSTEQLLPWDFLQGVAIVELYRRKHFVEPPENKMYPYSLLCQQTLSLLAENPEGMIPSELARTVLHLAPFSHISIDDFKLLLSNLCRLDYISKIGNGKLILGLAGERVISTYKFLACFKDEESYIVRDENGREVGILPEAVMPGGSFALAGRSWVCERLDSEQRTIYAHVVGGKMTSLWRGSLAGIDTQIAKFVKTVLSEDTVYPYLGKKATRILQETRLKARKMGIHEKNIIKTDKDSYIMFPWLGSRAMSTFRRYIEYAAENMLASRVTLECPYVFSFKINGRIEDFVGQLESNLFIEEEKYIALVGENEHYLIEKFDSLVPHELLKKAYITDRLDMTDVYALVKGGIEL